MTVPINIPIITTSPPSVKSAKSLNKPEKSGDFEQILKQKTSESSQADNGILQNDHGVKIQPQNDIESEVKPIKEETKSEKSAEESKQATKADESAQPSMVGPLVQTIFTSQAVPVIALNSTSIDQAKLESSGERAVELMEEGGSGSMNSEEALALLTQSATSSLSEETRSNSLGKTLSVNHPELVDQSAGKEVKDAKGIDRLSQPHGFDPSTTEPKLEAPFTQSLASAQDLTKNSGQSKAFIASSSVEPEKGSQTNPNEQSQMVEQNSDTFKAEFTSKQGKSGSANEKSFTTSAKVVQEPEVKGNILSQTVVQNEGVSPTNKDLADDVKAVSGVKSVDNAGKTERKMVVEAPPDAPEKAPPESTPGVVTDRMKADPFTGKINEPARLAEAQSTEILRQIGRQVAGSSNSGSQTIRIQLHPEDLGQIELRITSSSQGTHVSLIADQAGTGKLLETHIAQLKQTLSDAGVQMADVHVGQQAPQQSFRDPQSSQNPQQKNSRYDNRTVLGVEDIPANRSHSNSSLVDYRI